MPDTLCSVNTFICTSHRPAYVDLPLGVCVLLECESVLREAVSTAGCFARGVRVCACVCGLFLVSERI